MGKMSEIRSLLEQGKTMLEIESQGYIAGTIRKVVTTYNHDKRTAELRSLRANAPDLAPESLDPTHEPEQTALPQEDTMSAEEVQQLTANLKQLSDKVEALGSHPPGLCAADDCHPCLTSKREWGTKVAEEVRTRMIGELTAACEWAGTAEMLDAVSEIHEQWTTEGKPTKPREILEPSLIVAGVEIYRKGGP